MADDLSPIVQRAYDVAVALYDHVNRFPRAHKPLLGRELTGLALRLLARHPPMPHEEPSEASQSASVADDAYLVDSVTFPFRGSSPGSPLSAENPEELCRPSYLYVLVPLEVE